MHIPYKPVMPNKTEHAGRCRPGPSLHHEIFLTLRIFFQPACFGPNSKRM
jgi:hypothetical protein